ncbi:hypothetical protein ACIBBE_24780 [Streptomyces sp. NPDC051644]|uniref:hypothetical protein n=1 Tax=Streptomyces sp. NPDC051644 TaxID=3365666 RepID=UPI00378B6B50
MADEEMQRETSYSNRKRKRFPHRLCGPLHGLYIMLALAYVVTFIIRTQISAVSLLLVVLTVLAVGSAGWLLARWLKSKYPAKVTRYLTVPSAHHRRWASAAIAIDLGLVFGYALALGAVAAGYSVGTEPSEASRLTVSFGTVLLGYLVAFNVYAHARAHLPGCKANK